MTNSVFNSHKHFHQLRIFNNLFDKKTYFDSTNMWNLLAYDFRERWRNFRCYKYDDSKHFKINSFAISTHNELHNWVYTRSVIKHKFNVLSWKCFIYFSQSLSKNDKINYSTETCIKFFFTLAIVVNITSKCVWTTEKTEIPGKQIVDRARGETLLW